MSLTASVACFVGYVFLRSVWNKLQDRPGFASALAGYGFAIRYPRVPWLAVVLTVEGCAALLLLLSFSNSNAARAGAALALLFTGAGFWAIYLRRRLGEHTFSCGCGGNSGSGESANLMLLRNAALALLLAVVLLRPQPLLAPDYAGGLALLIAWDLLLHALLSEGRVKDWKVSGSSPT